MPRLARNQIQTTFFHNMTQGINKEYIFEENRCKKKYMELLQKEVNEFDIKLIAFTIMDNHAHILLYTENINHMSLFMKNINAKFAMYYNYIYKRVGIVFRNRYKSQPILSEKQLLNCIRYIFNNPVRAKIVLDSEEYVYSNFQEFKKKDNILDEIYKKINYSIKFPKINNEELILESDFLDTSEDKEIFIKQLINNYEKEHNLTICRNRKDMENIVKYIKREVTTKQNRPVKIVILTKEGEDVYIKTLNALRPGIQKMIQFITNKETDSIIKSLRRIRQAVKESIEIDI